MVSATTSCGCFAKTLAGFAALIAERKRSFRSCETGVFILHPVHGSTYPPNFCSKARNICLLFNKGHLAWAAIGRRPECVWSTAGFGGVTYGVLESLVVRKQWSQSTFCGREVMDHGLPKEWNWLFTFVRTRFYIWKIQTDGLEVP